MPHKPHNAARVSCHMRMAHHNIPGGDFRVMVTSELEIVRGDVDAKISAWPHKRYDKKYGARAGSPPGTVPLNLYPQLS